MNHWTRGWPWGLLTATSNVEPGLTALPIPLVMSMQALPLGYTLPLAQSETVTQQSSLVTSSHPPHVNGLPSLPRLNPRPAHVNLSLWALFLATLLLLSRAQSTYFLSI